MHPQCAPTAERRWEWGWGGGGCTSKIMGYKILCKVVHGYLSIYLPICLLIQSSFNTQGHARSQYTTQGLLFHASLDPQAFVSTSFHKVIFSAKKTNFYGSFIRLAAGYTYQVRAPHRTVPHTLRTPARVPKGRETKRNKTKPAFTHTDSAR